MPRHVWMMWLAAGGGSLVGASLLYVAERTRFRYVTYRVRQGWRDARDGA